MAFERFKQFNIDPLIAKQPATPRDSARLMVLHRDTHVIENRIFRDITDYFQAGDVLVLNNTKVFPAKLFAHKATGGKVEILLVRPQADPYVWTTLTRDYKENAELDFGDGLTGTMLGKTGNNEVLIRFNQEDILPFCHEHGLMPLPVYIEKARKHEGLTPSLSTDKERYQTVYAKYEGSIAAPTAGFHFTQELLDKLAAKGVQIAYITLHVGWGTFKPLRGEPEQHQMLPELAEISSQTAEIINQARRAQKAIFSVGTTSTRTLESFTQNGVTSSGKKWTDLFIYPGYTFKAITHLITNFHFPDSTPLCMVTALAGEDFIYQAYQEAVEQKYRFYSFGDSMLIL
ncbi:MAG: tRNA preQ1(34) S-adenosylmethionine ribosyltransferase-isomerase QueA [Elusimicrobiaceae bacterium]|nr:tRNA preQ1(34) S-adenosylmethionine ribosyltransferase-isomerase QueA [Elusimicrobiaceae bacterium]